MLKLLTGLLLLSLSFGVIAEDKERFLKVAQEYIDKNSTPAEEVKWEKKWAAHVETMLADRNATDEESALKRVVFDWCADNSGKWKSNNIPVKDKIQMCRYYLLCRRKGYTMPSQIEENLTDSNLDKYMEIEKKETTSQTSTDPKKN
jgi:hypothetical protein